MRTLALFVISAALACAQASLSPLGLQFFDANGKPLAGGKIYTCVAGATCPGTPLATYTDKTGAVAASNPIILDSAGRAASGGQNGIWLGYSLYKFVIQTSTGSLVRTYDGVGIGMADPGANGVMYRTAVNTTRAATLADLQTLGVLTIDPTAAPIDNEVLVYRLATGLLKASGLTSTAGSLATGTNGTQLTFTESAAPSAPLSGRWTWYVDSTSHVPKAVGSASSIFLGWFTTRGTSGHYALWDDTTGFKDGGPVASGYPTVTDGSPVVWDVASAAVANGTLTLNHATTTRSLNMSNMVSGGFYTLIVLEDSTGGATLSGGSGCTWVTPGGTGTGFFPLVTTASALNTVTFTYDGSRCYVLSAAYAGM